MNDLAELFKNSGGWMEGHTSFKNGFHGNGWFEKGFIMRNPKLLTIISETQANMIKQHSPDVDYLVGPAICGSILATHIDKYFNKGFVMTTGKGEELIFDRMFIPQKGSKLVITDDLVSSGADIASNVAFLKSKGMEVLGIFVWINRQQDEFDGVKVYSLIEPPFQYYTAENCPLCKSGVPIKYENVRE